MSTTPARRANGPRERRRHRGGAGLEPSFQGRIRLWGHHPVAAALANPERPCHRLLATATGLAALGEVDRPDLLRRTVEPQELDRLVPADSPHQGLLLEAGPLPDRELGEILPEPGSPALLLVLDQVSDPRNLGAILRTAAALGVAGVIVPNRHSAELGGVCAKAASGALDLVPIVEVVNLARTLAELKEHGFWTVGLDAAGPTLLDALPPEPRRVLVLGAEGAGLRRLVAERCDHLARIAIDPRMDSLNVSVAAGIALYLLRR